MTSPSITTGSCLCGGISFNINIPLKSIEVCHCMQCRKAQGSTIAAVTPWATAAWKVEGAQGGRGLEEE